MKKMKALIFMIFLILIFISDSVNAQEEHDCEEIFLSYFKEYTEEGFDLIKNDFEYRNDLISLVRYKKCDNSSISVRASLLLINTFIDETYFILKESGNYLDIYDSINFNIDMVIPNYFNLIKEEYSYSKSELTKNEIVEQELKNTILRYFISLHELNKCEILINVYDEHLSYILILENERELNDFLLNCKDKIDKNNEDELYCKNNFIEVKLFLERNGWHLLSNNPSLLGKLLDLSYGDRCEKTYWGDRALLLLQNYYIFKGDKVQAFYSFDNLFSNLEEIEKKSFWSKLFNYFYLFRKGLPVSRISDADLTQDYKDIRESALVNYLDFLYSSGDCRKYISLASYYEEIINYIDENDKKTQISERNEICIQEIRDYSENLINLNGEPIAQRITDTNITSDEIRKESIEVYFYNDYLSREEFEKKVNYFKTFMLDEAPEYEFLGMNKLEENPKLIFTAKYIEHDASLCNKFSFFEHISGALCSCDLSFFNQQAIKDGADVYFIITPNKCRSWANRFGFSVVSWPNTFEIDSGVNKKYEESFFKFILPKFFTNFYESHHNYIMSLAVLHELGHLAWGLADEYVESGRFKSTDFPNCADGLGEAMYWWSSLEGYYDQYYHQKYGQVDYFEGCGYSKNNVFRPTKQSIMNNPFSFGFWRYSDPVFGPVSNYYMTNFINIFDEFSIDEHYEYLGYTLSLSKEDETLSYEKRGLNFMKPRWNLQNLKNNFIKEYVSSEYMEDIDAQKYVWNLYSFYGDKLASEEFMFNDEIYVSRSIFCVDEDLEDYIEDCDEIPSLIKLNNPQTTLAIPYYHVGERVDILKGEEVVLSIDLSEYADYCGNDVCSLKDSYLTCPMDCDEEIKVYGYMNGVNKDFHIFKGTISGTGPVDIVYVKGGCYISNNNCVEFIENSDEINIFVRGHSDILIFNSKIYDVGVHYEQGTGSVLFETDKSKIFVTPTDIKTSFSDWDNPKITRTIQGNNCDYIFDGKTPEKLLINCFNN